MPWIMLAALAMAAPLAWRWSVGSAKDPEGFETSLASATARAAKEGKPVFAVATATWCGPCQNLKRDSLSDPEVLRLIGEHAVPVMVDVDKDREGAVALRVRGIPLTAVVVDGRIVARLEGYQPPGAYRSFVEAALDLAKNPEEAVRATGPR